MNEISKDKIYYGYFKDDKTTIKAYKVISIVFDIETECYTLTLNIANEGVKKVYSQYWYFYTSPLNVVNNESEFYLGGILCHLGCDNKSYCNDFRNALAKNGYEVNRANNIVYWVFDKTKGRVVSRTESIFCIHCHFIVGKYNLFTQEFEGLRFNPKWWNGRCKNIYKSKEECLDAQMPKVVEFEDEAHSDTNVVWDFKVSITAKNEDEAIKKFAKMLDLMDNL